MLVAACSDAGSAPTTPLVSTTPARVSSCVADTAQIQALIAQNFRTSPAPSDPQNSSMAAQNSWRAIVQSVTVTRDSVTARRQGVDLVDLLLSHNKPTPLGISATELASLVNQILCYVSLESNVIDPNNSWVVHVADPVTTLITTDKSNGLQLPPNGVVVNTVVAAVPTVPNSLKTLLDNYAVYEWSLTPAQTLTAGTTATIGMCPNPAMLANVPNASLDAVLARLVLGHQRAANSFELLERVPLPPEMVLICPTSSAGSLGTSWGGRLLQTLANAFLPQRANAIARRRFSGGVGGSTSEFSPFGPVDPQLFASGGVGGSTSEFVRTGASLLGADGIIDGTVGTTRSGATLPSVTVKTFLGTPIPGVTVTYATVPRIGYTPVGNATVCGATTTTSALGVAAVTCLNFGTTAQYRFAYTRLAATFVLPDQFSETDARGNPMVTIAPPFQNWMIVSHGPSDLSFALPLPGGTVAAGSPYVADAPVPTRVEIRSDLGELVPNATSAVTITLNQNAFSGGSTTATANAVGGVATFAEIVPTPATGYRFSASAALSDVGTVTGSVPSSIFDVITGAATRIAVVGSASYGSVVPPGNPVSPSPTVIVTDNSNNPVAGAAVFWTPSGATGAQANGAAGQTTTTTGSDGKRTVAWRLGSGPNQLRASLQSAPGGAEIAFTATFSNPATEPCEPGAVKDAFGNCYFVVPGSPTGGSLFRMSNWLTTTGH